MWKSFHKYFLLTVIMLTPLVASQQGIAAEEVAELFAGQEVIVSGTIESLACAAACGVCCATHSIIDRSETISLQVGNSFVDLSTISDDEKTHRFSGYLYQGAGQCGINECTFFAVESVDQQFIPAPNYNTADETLVIESISSSDTPDESFTVSLSPPFNLQELISQDDKFEALQGEDCSTPESSCQNGTVCVSYFGIAGANGPEFQTCEVPCSHPGVSCPIGQSCTTIADGPGQVCVVD